MKALVTGANGFLGAALCGRLSQRENEVFALVRKGADTSALDEIRRSEVVTKLRLVEGDVTDPDSLKRACEEHAPDVLFHLAGIRRSPHRDDFFRVNTEGTRAACEALSATGRRRFVLCGSLSATGPSTPDHPRTEDDGFAPQEWYGESKVEAEQLAHGFSDRLDVTTIRPARILGPGDKENLAFFKLVKKGLLLSVRGGPRPMSMVDVEDVVDQLLLQAERKEAVGQAFFCAARETTTLEELQETVAEAIGATPRRVNVFPWTLQLLAEGADVASKLTGKHLPLNRKLARQLLAPAWTCSTQKAEALLGFRARRGILDSIRRSAAWYQARGFL